MGGLIRLCHAPSTQPVAPCHLLCSESIGALQGPECYQHRRHTGPKQWLQLSQWSCQKEYPALEEKRKEEEEVHNPPTEPPFCKSKSPLAKLTHQSTVAGKPPHENNTRMNNWKGREILKGFITSQNLSQRHFVLLKENEHRAIVMR